MDKELAAALFAAQEAMPDLVKDSTNPHFKNTYVSLDRVLDTVQPVLRAHGLMVTQSPDRDVLTTRITLVENGESFVGEHPLVLERETPQAIGSAITYARRYALLAMLGLTADEDDDGVAASAVVHSGRKSEASGTKSSAAF